MTKFWLQKIPIYIVYDVLVFTLPYVLISGHSELFIVQVSSLSQLLKFSTETS